MKIRSIFRKDKKDDLTPEEAKVAHEMEYEPVPDMQDIQIKGTEKLQKEGETLEVQEKIDLPEAGVLLTEGLVKRYGKRTVANHVSINVKQGEIVGLLGPNGAGKSTTMNMITGFIEQTERRNHSRWL